MHTNGDGFTSYILWSANNLLAFKYASWCASVMRTLGG
jgi:hypothetical protein